jgi:hypothetical protein
VDAEPVPDIPALPLAEVAGRRFAAVDAWSRQQKNTVQAPMSKTETNPKQMPSKKAGKDAGGKRRKMV